MTHLRLIQIGDIHFPESSRETLADLKDASFPTPIIAELLARPLQLVIREVMKHFTPSRDAILFCGDLTSYGNVAEYGKAVAYVLDALKLRSVEQKFIHAVPGNHDVDRTQIDNTGINLFAKFSPAEQAWADAGVPILAVQKPRITTFLRSNIGALRLLSINSSIGCGERRHLPKDISGQLADALKGHVDAVGLRKAFELVGETLDTPAFRQEDILTILDDIEGLDAKALPVILSHHNILPQSLLRIELYTELLNAGLVRSRLCELRRPVIYCHGHVHDDPIDIVHKPDAKGSTLLCISAPLLSRGFNIIDIHFGKKRVPLGCLVTQFRLDTNDCSFGREETRVNLYNATHREVRRLGHEKLPSILACFPEGEFVLPELHSKLGLSLTVKSLAEAIEEGEWLGQISINNREQEYKHWYVQKLNR